MIEFLVLVDAFFLRLLEVESFKNRAFLVVARFSRRGIIRRVKI